jgi:protein SCO1/2
VATLWQAFGPRAPAAPDFTLIDQAGKPFTPSAQRGHPVALIFGYTHCPDVCPTTLAHAAPAFHTPDVPQDARLAFITVDPYRDSPAVLGRYIRLFDPAFVGLTADLNVLDPVYANYYTWRQAVPVHHGEDDYSMAHGTTIYYIGRSGSLNGFGHWDDSIETIAHGLKRFQ